MNRREFLQTAAICTAALHVPQLHAIQTDEKEESIKDYLYRIRHPDMHHDGDILANDGYQKLLYSVNQRLTNVLHVVGYGNFNVLSFDEMLLYANRYSQIGSFSQKELDLLESLFYADASVYGFYGQKPVDKLTETIDKRAVSKIPGTGHYLFDGKPVQLYEKIRKEVGDNIILTSGIRGIVKQMQLFISKATRFEGNLSLASRSLAPPGYSFHGIGDFDVGIVGWGEKNFTEDFSTTDEFKRLIDLGYIDIRYPIDNMLGVRFEPWHIKVL